MAVKNSGNQRQQQSGTRKPDTVKSERRQHSDGMLYNQKR